MPYSKDSDLLKVQKDILALGVDSWLDQHEEAKLIIDRDLNIRWFRKTSITGAFDADKISDKSQIKRLSVYKTLYLAYLYLMQDVAESEAFKDKRDLFDELYNNELDLVVESGVLLYDADGSGGVSDAERLASSADNYRQLSRY